MTEPNIESITAAAYDSAIRQYGDGFAQWAEALGVRETDAEEDTRSRYLGSWASISAFGRQFAAELGLTEGVQVRADLRPYVAIDTDALVMDMLQRRELQTIEDGRGLVHVFIGPGTIPEADDRGEQAGPDVGASDRTG